MVKQYNSSILKIVYSFAVFDLPHYGHLRLLRNAKSLGGYAICGLLTDQAVMAYKRKPIMPFWQRKAIAEEFRCIDMVMEQDSKDPTENLKQIHRDFPNAQIILVHGDNWIKKDFPGRAFVEKIGGKLVLLPYYKPLSTKILIDKIGKTWLKKDD